MVNSQIEAHMTFHEYTFDEGYLVENSSGMLTFMKVFIRNTFFRTGLIEVLKIKSHS